VLFGESLTGIDKDTLLEIFAEVPSTTMPAERFANGMPLVSLLVETRLAESKGAARRLIEGGGVYLNNERATEVSMQIGSQALIGNELLILRTGRKSYHLVLASSALA
jgi:tyrosyl-tRNA synthetase